MSRQISSFIRKYFEGFCRDCGLDPAATTVKAQQVYEKLMQKVPDMGKKGNMMASNLDMTAAFFAYYEASDHKIGPEAIDILTNRLADDYQWVTFFTDMNRHRYVRPLYYHIYRKHAAKVEQHKARGEWTGTWSIRINPEDRNEGIAYHMTNCPLLAFARMHGYEDMMPAICRFDFIFERFLHARLIRTRTEATGSDCCDYWFIPDTSDLAEQYKDFTSI